MCDIWNIIMKGSDISWNVRRFSIIFPPLSLIMHSAPFFQKPALGPANMGRDSLKFNVCMKQWNSVWSQESWCWWTMMNLRNHVGNIWEIMLSGGNIFLLLICMITLRGEEADKRDCSLIIFHWPLTIDYILIIFYWPLSIGYILIIFHWHWRLIVFWLYSINHSPLIIFLFKTGL